VPCVWPGVHAVKLEEVERRLRNDLMHEAMAWGGRLLLHRDVSVNKPAGQAAGGASHSHQAVWSDDDDITQNDELMPDNNAITAFWDSTGNLPHSCLSTLYCSWLLFYIYKEGKLLLFYHDAGRLSCGVHVSAAVVVMAKYELTGS
jgi:hypothetical protein